MQPVFGPLWYQNDEWSRLRFAWRGPHFTGYQDVIRRDGATTHYRLNEAADVRTFADVRGTAHAAPTVGTLTRHQRGPTVDPGDFAIGIEAGSSFAVASDASLHSIGSGTFSVAGWVYQPPGATTGLPQTNVAHKHPAFMSTSSWRGWRLRLDGIFGPSFLVDVGTGTPGAFTTGLNTPLSYQGSWHHVAGVFDRTAGRMTCFFDGAIVGSLGITVSSGLFASNTNTLGIGGIPRSPGFLADFNNVDALVDEVAIFNGVALTVDQVRQHMAYARRPPTPGAFLGMGVASVTGAPHGYSFAGSHVPNPRQEEICVDLTFVCSATLSTDIETLAACVRSGRNGFLLEVTSGQFRAREVNSAGTTLYTITGSTTTRVGDVHRWTWVRNPDGLAAAYLDGIGVGLTAGAGSWSAAELTFHRANAIATGVCSHGAVARAAVLTGTTVPKTKPGPLWSDFAHEIVKDSPSAWYRFQDRHFDIRGVEDYQGSFHMRRGGGVSANSYGAFATTLVGEPGDTCITGNSYGAFQYADTSTYFDIHSGFTWECYFKTTNDTDTVTLLRRGAAAGHYAQFQLFGGAFFARWSAVDGSIGFFFKTGVADNQPHQAAITRSGSLVQFVFDGVVTDTSSSATTWCQSGFFYVGMSNELGGLNDLVGTEHLLPDVAVDEVVIYRHPVSAARLAAHWDAVHGRFS